MQRGERRAEIVDESLAFGTQVRANVSHGRRPGRHFAGRPGLNGKSAERCGDSPIAGPESIGGTSRRVADPVMRISLRELMIVVAVAAVGFAGLKFASGGMLPIVQAMTGLLLLGLLVLACVDRGQRQAFAIGFLLCGVAYLVVTVLSIGGLQINHADGSGSRDSVELTSPTGMFGTEVVTYWLYRTIRTDEWINSATGRVDANFRPTEAEQRISHVVRIELQQWESPTDDKAKSGTPRDVVVDEDVAVGGALGGRSSRSARSGRGGRGGALFGGGGGRGGRRPDSVTAQLTSEQLSEFLSADTNRQSQIADIFNHPEGQQAVLSGRPLSTINRVVYQRRDVPSLGDFQKAGYCLWTLLIGYIGGSFARFVYQRRNKATTNH